MIKVNGGLEFTAEETGAHGYCNSLHQNEKLKIRILRYGPCMWLKTKVAISKQGWNQRFENPCKKSLNVRKIMRDLKHSVTKFIQIHTFSSFCTHFSFYYLFSPSVPSFHPFSSFVYPKEFISFSMVLSFHKILISQDNPPLSVHLLLLIVGSMIYCGACCESVTDLWRLLNTSFWQKQLSEFLRILRIFLCHF